MADNECRGHLYQHLPSSPSSSDYQPCTEPGCGAPTHFKKILPTGEAVASCSRHFPPGPLTPASVADEREACAEIAAKEGPCCLNQKCHEAIAAAIRARGPTQTIPPRGQKYYHRVRNDDMELEFGAETLAELQAIIAGHMRGWADEAAVRRKLTLEEFSASLVEGFGVPAGPSTIPIPAEHQAAAQALIDDAPRCLCGAKATHATRDKGGLYYPYCAEHAPSGAFGLIGFEIIPEAKDAADAPVVAKPANPFERDWR